MSAIPEPPGRWADADRAAAVTLASLPGVGPARLRLLLEGRSPGEALARVAAGHGHLLLRAEATAGAGAGGESAARLSSRWAEAARSGPADPLAAYREAGVAVLLPGDPDYPAALEADEARPAVLFSVGRPPDPSARRVAVIGTRRCTATGREVAFEFGRDLTAAGVTVVSGLALGIDGQSHAGALAAAGAPVAVVGSGLDVVYPERNRHLWRAVAEAGCVYSEAPLGARPEPWRFPARNRILAALAEVVVVVESHITGGSMHTVEEALSRGVPVMAVPGSVRSRASDGCNDLLAAGAAPARDAGDVLVALGLTMPVPPSRSPGPAHQPAATGSGRSDPGLVDDPRALALLAAVAPGESVLTDTLLARTGLLPVEAASALTALADAGLLARDAGWWRRC